MLSPIFRLVLLLPLLLISKSVYPAAGADNIVYQQCYNEYMQQLDGLVKMCVNLAAKDAAASANPGVAVSGMDNSSGLAEQCRQDQERSLASRATKECTTKARGVMMSAVDEDRDLEKQKGDTDGTCKPAPGITCPAANAPLPRSVPGRAQTPAKATDRTAPSQTRSQRETTANNNRAVDSARNVTPQSTPQASSEASSDISLCESSYSMASRCCGNPGSCAGELSAADQQRYAALSNLSNNPPSSSSGLTDYCNQMQSLGGTGSTVNSGLAGICNSKQMSCSMVCSELANKYLTLMSNCNGCESQGIYQNTYSQLSSRNSSCNALASRVGQISSQAANSTSSGAYGGVCNNVTSAAPTSTAGSGLPTTTAGANVSDPYGCQSNPNSAACRSCESNPNGPACVSTKTASGTAQFEAGAAPSNKKTKADFNIPSLDESFTGVPASDNKAPAVKVATVANNTGGGIPGGAGGPPAKLDGPRGNPSAGSPGYTTDVLGGMQGGGGYSSPVDNQFGGGPRDPANAGYGGRAAGEENSGGLLGVDLRQFLPGGSRDPQRRLAGIGSRSEINAKEEDIWRRISSKMEEKCKLGVLIGCR